MRISVCQKLLWSRPAQELVMKKPEIVVGHGKVVIVAEPLMHSKTWMNQIVRKKQQH